MGGLCERRSEREGTVRRGGVRPSCTEATIGPYRPHIEVGLDEEDAREQKSGSVNVQTTARSTHPGRRLLLQLVLQRVYQLLGLGLDALQRRLRLPQSALRLTPQAALTVQLRLHAALDGCNVSAPTRDTRHVTRDNRTPTSRCAGWLQRHHTDT